MRLIMETPPSVHQPPPAIVAAAAPPGSGWTIAHTVRTPPPRTISQAGRAKLRRAALERRIARKAPLFAAEIRAREIAARPDYFAGADFHR